MCILIYTFKLCVLFVPWTVKSVLFFFHFVVVVLFFSPHCHNSSSEIGYVIASSEFMFCCVFKHLTERGSPLFIVVAFCVSLSVSVLFAFQLCFSVFRFVDLALFGFAFSLLPHFDDDCELVQNFTVWHNP